MDETVTVVTLKSHQYAGKVRAVGEEFQAFTRDLRLISALGWVKEKTVEIPKAREDSIIVPEKPPKGRYKRRDLRAE